MSNLSLPENLKPGDFIAVCPHLFDTSKETIELPDAVYWACGGVATCAEDPSRERVFAARVHCGMCVEASTPVEYKAAKFWDGTLHCKWWQFVPNKPIGRPRKKKIENNT